MKEKTVEKNIINAAVAVFIEKGKDGARMQEIADRAGVNKMLLHYYFRDKDTLFLEVVRKIIADLYGSVFNGDMIALPFREFLSVFIDRHFAFLNEKKDTFQFLLWELSRRELNLQNILFDTGDTYGQNPFEILTAKLAEAAGKGEIRQVNPAAFVMNLFSLDLFPFVALPVIRKVVAMGDEELAFAVEQRKKEVFRLLWNDIQKV